MWNTIANSNGESDCNCYSYSYSYWDSHSYIYTDTDAYCYLDPETHPDATVSAHSAAATVSLGSQVISCSHGSVSRVNALTSRRGDRYNLGVPSSRSTSKSKKRSARESPHRRE